jgi:hypothetical protein
VILTDSTAQQYNVDSLKHALDSIQISGTKNKQDNDNLKTALLFDLIDAYKNVKPDSSFFMPVK